MVAEVKRNLGLSLFTTSLQTDVFNMITRHKSQIMMADDKNEMLEDNIGFKKTLGDKIENFINVTSKELKDEAFRL